MSIGFGIFLMATGAILTFGLRDRSDAIDLPAIGVILMLAGAAGIWLSYLITNRRRRVATQALDEAVEEEYRTVQSTGRIRAYVARRPKPAPATTDTPTARTIDLDPAASDLPTTAATAAAADIAEHRPPSSTKGRCRGEVSPCVRSGADRSSRRTGRPVLRTLPSGRA
ncbi:DUF6458 family protein [Kribbella capetownensis]|uniref:DUF6458 family protein n=1 Tax=Kribbella capetownensis TaxID=1572659 RepID=UPI00192DAD62|nr:DUF6458 family protein [Kribbella capetownensis]